MRINVRTSNQKVVADGVFPVAAYQITFVNNGTADVSLYLGGQREDAVPLAAGDKLAWSTGNPDWPDTSNVKIEFGSSGTKILDVIRTAKAEE